MSASRTHHWRLAVACARRAAGLIDDDGVRQVAGRHELATSLHLVRDQGLLPWLVRSVGSNVELQAVAGADAATTLSQVQRLLHLLALMHDAGVSALPYKGPLLSLQLYGDVALRRSTDLDIVVPRADYAAARTVLASAGLASRHGHSATRERALFSWLGHASFGAGNDFVELHWRFAPASWPFALTPESAIARAEGASVAGRPVAVMARLDLIAALAMHGVRHLYERLEWLAGVTRLLRDHEGHAEQILAVATRYRTRRALLASVSLARDVLDFPVSPEWASALAGDPRAERLAHEIHAHMIAAAVDGVPMPEGAALQMLHARALDSRYEGARLLVLAAAMPTERESELVALPDALTPLYRAIRPVRLLLRPLALRLSARVGAARLARRLFG